MQPKSDVAENRSGDRTRVDIQVQISGTDADAQYACLLMDASRTGCKLYCDGVDALPDDVVLHPEGLAEPIKASIVWRNSKLAELAFNWPSKPSAG